MTFNGEASFAAVLNVPECTLKDFLGDIAFALLGLVY